MFVSDVIDTYLLKSRSSFEHNSQWQSIYLEVHDRNQHVVILLRFHFSTSASRCVNRRRSVEFCWFSFQDFISSYLWDWFKNCLYTFVVTNFSKCSLVSFQNRSSSCSPFSAYLYNLCFWVVILWKMQLAWRVIPRWIHDSIDRRTYRISQILIISVTSPSRTSRINSNTTTLLSIHISYSFHESCTPTYLSKNWNLNLQRFHPSSYVQNKQCII